jgi:hypothetical protein
MAEQYKEVKTINFPGMVAKVYRPILTAEEQARRNRAIHREAERLLRAVN